MPQMYTGLLLCGGQSLRSQQMSTCAIKMKDIKLKWIRNAVTQDKSFLRHPQSNLPLFQHILQNVILPLNLPGNIVISCRDNAQATRILAVPGVAAIANVVLDDIELLGDIGPARGLLSAHLRYPGITYVVIGVDFPQANSEALYELMAGHKAMDKDSPVTCFVHPEDGHPEVSQCRCSI